MTQGRVSTGSGTPQGVITANVGSIYLRTDGGASTTLYVKESGSGNTGWVATGVGGVASFAKSGDSALTGAVTISGGTGISLTESGQDVAIAATGSAAVTFLSIEKWGI